MGNNPELNQKPIKSSISAAICSKYLTIALFIILPFVGFYFGTQYEKRTLLSNDAVLTAACKSRTLCHEETPNTITPTVYESLQTAGKKQPLLLSGMV